MKRKNDNLDDFTPNKRRRVDAKIEQQLIESNAIYYDEECTADEETLLVSEDEEQLKQLVDRLPDLNRRFGAAYDLEQTPLMIAIENGMTELAKYLIQEKKVDLAIQDDNLQTALHYACENSNEELIGIIIDIKKDDNEYLDQSDVDGITPLIYAARNGCTATVFKLLALRVRWCFEDHDGDEFSLLTEARDTTLLNEFRLQYKKSFESYVEASDAQKQLVSKLIENRQVEKLNLITPYNLDEDDDYDHIDDPWEDNGNGPSHFEEAIVAESEMALRYLHSKGAWFRGLGHIAVDTDNFDIVKLLHEFGCLVGNQKSVAAALEAAVENENYEMLEYLLTEVGMADKLTRKMAKIPLRAALLIPESSSFTRSLVGIANLPRNLKASEMNPFIQDFYDRYLRSHIFGPKMRWWSPNEALFVRSFGQSKFEDDNEGVEDDVCHLMRCINDSKRQIFGYLNSIEDISSVMLTCKEFSELILSQEYWRAQWFATYELAVIDVSTEADWKKWFTTIDKLLKTKVTDKYGGEKLWKFNDHCRVARVCVLKGSYCYQVRAQDGATSTRTITPSEDDPLSHFITCELNEEINFDVEESPLPMNRIKQFLPGGQIELVDYTLDSDSGDRSESYSQ